MKDWQETKNWICIVLKVSKRQQTAMLHYNGYNILKTNKKIKILSSYILYTTTLFFS